MTTVRRARVLKADPARAGRPVVALPALRDDTRRRIAKEGVDASLLAKKLLDAARLEADAILERARADARQAAEKLAAEVRDREVARLAAGFLALRAGEERRAERDLDRAVDLARVLAERLLGEALDADPARVVLLARQALREARGAQRIAIDASPLDAETLRSHVVDIGLPQGMIDVKTDPTLSRGSLRVHTNLGSMDAQLTPQLERLAAALRDALA